MNIDKIDLQILDCLNKNSRIPFSTIAKEVGLTSTAVGQRVQKMVEEQIIEGFGIKLNPEKLDIHVQAIITLKLNFSKIEAFNKQLQSFEEIQFCYRVTGDDCMIMKVHLKNNKHLLQFLDRITSYGLSKTNIIIDQLV